MAKRSRSRLLPLTGLSLSAVVAFTGCVVEHHHDQPTAVTTIEFDELPNLGYACGGPAQFSWSVTARETADQGTAGCQQPILFVNYTPGATYTFDVVGYDGSKVCWQGSCSVVAQPVETTFADCSSQIAHLCGY